MLKCAVLVAIQNDPKHNKKENALMDKTANATFMMTYAPGKYRYLLIHTRNRADQPQQIEHYEFRSSEDHETMQRMVPGFLAYIKDPCVAEDQTLLINLSDNDVRKLPCLSQLMT